MSSKTYMQRVREEKKARLIKGIVWFLRIVILASMFIIGFKIGRIEKAENTYNPDPCTLDVVVCENEPGYIGQ